MILAIDLETYSELDLTKVGLYRYAENSEILLFAFCELLIVGTKEISQVSDYAFTHHEVSNFFDSFHINQSF